jgi:Protein of unknown function (DUF3987)
MAHKRPQSVTENISMNPESNGKLCNACGAVLATGTAIPPEARHPCGRAGCVICQHCGSPACSTSAPSNEGAAAKLRAMVQDSTHPQNDTASVAPAPRVARVPQLPAVDPFPTDVLPSRLAKYVRGVARAFGCPEDYPGILVVNLAGGAIGNRRCIVLKPTWTESASTWMAGVGPPGSLKTPVSKHVSRKLHKRQLALEAEFLPRWRMYQDELEKHKRVGKNKPETAGSRSGGSAGVEPTLERCVIGDATTEAVASLLRQNRLGLAAIFDELVAWPRTMNQYRRGKGGDRQFYMESWSGSPIVRDRKGEPCPVIVPTPFISIIGWICPSMLGELKDEGEREDGFIDRLLFCYPDPVPPALWSEETISAEIENGWQEILDKLWALKPDENGGHPHPVAVELTSAAKAVWSEFYNDHIRESAAANFPSNLKGPWAKLRSYAARFALILHELRFAAGEISSDREVDEETMQRAIALVEYFASHTVRAHAVLTEAPNPANDDDVLLALLSSLVANSGGQWHGTAAALLKEMTAAADDDMRKSGVLPSGPVAVGWALRRLAPRLENQRNITATFNRGKDRKRTRQLILQQLSEASDLSASSANGHTTDVSGPDGSDDGAPDRTGSRHGNVDSLRTAPSSAVGSATQPSKAETTTPEQVTASADSSDGSQPGTRDGSASSVAAPEVGEGPAESEKSDKPAGHEESLQPGDSAADVVDPEWGEA